MHQDPMSGSQSNLPSFEQWLQLHILGTTCRHGTACKPHVCDSINALYTTNITEGKTTKEGLRQHYLAMKSSAATIGSQVIGLGGVDPKTSGSMGQPHTGSSGRSITDCNVPPELVTKVTELQKYMKEQEDIRDNIVMSAPTLSPEHVQKVVASLKQLLFLASSSLHRNITALDKLKVDTAKEHSNAEMIQRVRRTVSGPQHADNEINEYFVQLTKQFEDCMASYRQQIEALETHVSASQQPVRHSPAEIFALIKQQHESFIALAARFQNVHESIKLLKGQLTTASSSSEPQGNPKDV